MRGNRGRWSWLVATVLGVAAFGSLTALASGALSEHKDSVKIPSLKDKTATASCSKGTEAVSGGFAAPGFDPQFNGPSILPFGSRRAGDDAWTVDAKNFGASSGKLVSYAYCDKHEPNLAVAKKTKTIASNDNGSAAAKCPSGS